MELKSLRSLITEANVSLDLSKGVHWIVAVDSESCDEIFKMITLANDQDFECEIHGLLQEDSEKAKSWVKSQGIKINCYISEDPSITENLGIRSVPWFVCIDSGKLSYSSEKIPSDLRPSKNNEDDLTELKSPDKILLGSSSLKRSIELPNTSLLINKASETQLEKALRKIEKLKLKVRQQERTIEDYKIEMRHLKSLLQVKPPDPPIKHVIEDLPAKSVIRHTFKLESISNKNRSKTNQRAEENEFWKIEDRDDLLDSVNFEEIAATKDLWLMGLLKQQDSPRTKKASKILPPLQVTEKPRPGRLMARENSQKKSADKRNNSSIAAGYSSRKLVKNRQ